MRAKWCGEGVKLGLKEALKALPGEASGNRESGCKSALPVSQTRGKRRSIWTWAQLCSPALQGQDRVMQSLSQSSQNC